MQNQKSVLNKRNENNCRNKIKKLQNSVTKYKL